jgi:hypothetical protein
MFERIVEKADLKKYNFDDQTYKVVLEFLQKDEYVEIVTANHSLLGLKPHIGKEVLYAFDEDTASKIRLMRDELGDWHKFLKMPLTSERQFKIHMDKLSLSDHIRKKIGNLNFNKPTIKKKLAVINSKLTKTHERLQGVFIFHSELSDLLTAFDSKIAVFACKLADASELDKLLWINSIKKANIIVFCPDDKEVHKFLTKANCDKLKVGRSKNKNIWTRTA